MQELAVAEREYLSVRKTPQIRAGTSLALLREQAGTKKKKETYHLHQYSKQ